MKEVDPTQLDSQLYHSIDASSLNAMLSTCSGVDDDPGSLTVSFTHDGYDVTVSRNGQFRIARMDSD